MRGPKFSIIVPTFNRLNLLKEAVNSVKRQKFDSWELIIVDNESTDGTQDYLNSISTDQIKWFTNDTQKCIAKSRNIGLSQASGDWIAFLDSDDFWHSDKLLIVDGHTDCSDFVYHDAFILEESKFSKEVQPLKRQLSRELKKDSYFDLLINGNCIVNSSVVVKKASLAAVRGFDESPNLFAVEDYDCWLRLAKIKTSFFYLSEPLVTYRIHSSNSGNINNLAYLQRAISHHLVNLSPLGLKKFYSLYQYQVLRRHFQSLPFVSFIRQALSPLVFGRTNIRIRVAALIFLVIVHRISFGLFNTKL